MKRSVTICLLLCLLFGGCSAPVTNMPVLPAAETQNTTASVIVPATASAAGFAVAPQITAVLQETASPEATPEPVKTTATTETVKPATAKPTTVPPQERANGSLQGLVIGIDPGHQGKSNSEQEPVSPGSAVTKKKVSSGTQGKWSRVPEYEVVLTVGLQLKTLLEEVGATVIMTRETNNVNISNAERAVMMNEAQADLVLRIHCDGSTNSSVYGASMLVPAGESTKEIQAVSAEAGEVILDRFAAVTGAKNRGVVKREDLTGFNWSTVPVCLIEMGYMSNEQEDLLLTSKAYQQKCAEGLYQGILLYFN